MKIDKENIKKGLKNFTDGTKGVVKKTTNAVIKKIDQNDDSTFDKEDLKAIKNKINSTAQKASSNIKKAVDDKRKENDLKKLQPIFAEDLEKAEFVLPKLICVSNIDKKYSESDVCQGAIGYKTDCKELTVINIFKENIELFGLTFYPDIDSEVYYVDPTDKNRYIALEDYFSYLQEVRVNELEKIAQDLGAKHFRITLMEEKKTFTKQESKRRTNGNYGVAGGANVDTEHEQIYSNASKIKILAEDNFPGHSPIKPNVQYLAKESNIQTLIDLRLKPESPLTSRKFAVELSKSSGMKKRDAEKIDVALKMMKISGNTTVSNEVSEEYRKYFEYEIEF